MYPDQHRKHNRGPACKLFGITAPVREKSDKSRTKARSTPDNKPAAEKPVAEPEPEVLMEGPEWTQRQLVEWEPDKQQCSEGLAADLRALLM